MAENAKKCDVTPLHLYTSIGDSLLFIYTFVTLHWLLLNYKINKTIKKEDCRDQLSQQKPHSV